jgi:hypothetical protein
MPFQRVLNGSGTVRKSVKTQLLHQNKPLNPAAVQHQIQARYARVLHGPAIFMARAVSILKR